MNPAQADRRPGYSRVLTIPNVVSFARLMGILVFLFLFLCTDHMGWAIVILVVGGATDWVDGYLARRMHQVSRLGELLDPSVDRLYLFATVLALTARGIIPWPFTVALLSREALLGVCLLVLRSNGSGPPPVHYVGKTATFLLLAAFPTLLLAWAVPAVAPVAGACGWALAWWGIVLYWIAAALYVWQVRRMIAATR